VHLVGYLYEDYHDARFQPDSPRQRPHNLHETYQLPRVQLITPDDGHRRFLKNVEFRDKIKFWILDVSCWLFIRRFNTRVRNLAERLVNSSIPSVCLYVGNEPRTVSGEFHEILQKLT
jgi:hypothetical protein